MRVVKKINSKTGMGGGIPSSTMSQTSLTKINKITLYSKQGRDKHGRNSSKTNLKLHDDLLDANSVNRMSTSMKNFNKLAQRDLDWKPMKSEIH